MATIPKKVTERVVSGIKKYQPLLASAKSRDVGEADTVTLIKDMLSDIFGYDKYAEVTSEFSIRGTYCDLAVKLDNRLSILIEAKAIGIDLKEQHTKQAIDYAANQGLDWVVLTNGTTWLVYKVIFEKPIDKELVVSLDMSSVNHRSQTDIESLYLLCKEGWIKSALGDYHTQRQALSRFFIGAMLQTDSVLD
jgi:predicted type IV restriction endonuclease